MKYFELVELKYDNFKKTITSKISDLLSGYDINFGNNTIFGQIINVTANIVQNIMLYIEDAVSEQNKVSAQRKSSIYGLAQLSGYTPSLGKASGCNVVLSFVPNSEKYSNTIILKNRTQLYCSKNGMLYNLILPQESIYLSPTKDNSSKYLYAVEGRFEQQSFTSDGGQLWSKTLNIIGNLDLDYFSLYVNNVLWERVDSIYDMTANGKQYVVRPNISKGIDIIFGNGQHGKVLEEGDSVYVDYLIHTGSRGNMSIETDCYFTFKDKLTDTLGEQVSGNSIFLIKADNTENITCGTDAEDIFQIQEMIGYNSRSFCLSDPKNYKVYINRFSFCGYNRTWCEEGSLVVNSLIMEKYSTKVSKGSDYFNLDESDFVLSDDQKETIINSITQSGQQLAGSIYNIYDPKLCKYALYLYIKLKDSAYDQNSVETQIRNLVGNFFCNVESDEFIPKSDIIHLLKRKITEIDSVDAYFLSEKNETALKNGYYKIPSKTYNPKTKKYEQTEQVVYLYPGEDPGLGLDSHGNILLENDDEFPILKGGWTYLSKNDENVWEKTEGSISDPLIIVFT